MTEGGRAVGRGQPPASWGPLGGMVPFITGAAAMFAAQYSTQAILPTLSREFEITPSTAGLSVSMPILALAVAAWVWGPLSHRIGRKRSVVLASGLLVIPSVVVALAPTYPILLVARVAQGFCMPGLLTVGVVYVSDLYVPRIGARAMGYYLSSLTVGGLIARVGVGELAALTSWRIALLVLPILPLAASLSLRRTLPEEAAAPAGGPPLNLASVAAAFRNRRLVAVTIAGAMLFFGMTATFSYAEFRLEADPFNIPPAGASLIFFLWLLGLVGPLAGRLADHIGWQALALGAFATVSLGLGLTLVPSLPIVIVGLALLAASAFSGFTASQLGLAGTIGKDRALGTALYYSVYYSVGAVGGYLPGIAWEHWAWAGVVATGLAAFAAGAGTLLLVRPGATPEPARLP